MSKIELEGVAHTYESDSPDPLYALEEFSLTWDDGGRYAVLGPSGCGKTTMLNIMSGIVTPTSGRVCFDGLDVTKKSTSNRNIAQVFQFPVIYGTMSVERNLSFPLICRNVPSDRIREKVKEVAETLSLVGLLDRRASGLTADQKQMISLGRGLVRDDVAAILMDEPLTVIDPDLKFRLRRKLKEINKKYNSTLIYVTHDQNEAMTFAEKVVVMDNGRIVQIGSPRELFERPRTVFVGYFIGSPAMNMFGCSISSDYSVKVGDIEFTTKTRLGSLSSGVFRLGIRAEFIELVPDLGPNCVLVDVTRVDDYGNFRLLSARHEQLEVKTKLDRQTEISDRVILRFPPERLCVYRDDILI